jgi:hypothetical protein
VLEAPLSPEMREGFRRFGFDQHEADADPFKKPANKTPAKKPSTKKPAAGKSSPKKPAAKKKVRR